MITINTTTKVLFSFLHSKKINSSTPNPKKEEMCSTVLMAISHSFLKKTISCYHSTCSTPLMAKTVRINGPNLMRSCNKSDLSVLEPIEIPPEKPAKEPPLSPPSPGPPNNDPVGPDIPGPPPEIVPPGGPDVVPPMGPEIVPPGWPDVTPPTPPEIVPPTGPDVVPPREPEPEPWQVPQPDVPSPIIY